MYITSQKLLCADEKDFFFIYSAARDTMKFTAAKMREMKLTMVVVTAVAGLPFENTEKSDLFHNNCATNKLFNIHTLPFVCVCEKTFFFLCKKKTFLRFNFIYYVNFFPHTLFVTRSTDFLLFDKIFNFLCTLKVT